MRYFNLAIIVILVGFGVAAAQPSQKFQGGYLVKRLEKLGDDERNFLRRGFKLPESADVNEAKLKADKFDTSRAISVDIDSIVDQKVRDGVAAWIDKWNAGEGAKVGKVERAADGLKADLTLVRYLRPVPASDQMSSMTWTDENGKRQPLIPVYSYIMVRKPDRIEIVWRKIDLTYREEYELGIETMSDQLARVVREIYKGQKP